MPQLGIRSLIAVPLSIGTEVIGLINFQFVKQPCDWRPDVVSRLRLIGEVFADASVRSSTGAGTAGKRSSLPHPFRRIRRSPLAWVGTGLTCRSTRPYLKMFGFHRSDEVVGRRIADHWLAWRTIIDQLARQRSAGLPVASEYQRSHNVRTARSSPALIMTTTVESSYGRATLAFLPTSRRPTGGREVAGHAVATDPRVARLSMLGEMVAGARHELNHPLYATLNLCQGRSKRARRRRSARSRMPCASGTRKSPTSPSGPRRSSNGSDRSARRGEIARVTCRMEDLIKEALGLMAIEFARRTWRRTSPVRRLCRRSWSTACRSSRCSSIC